MNRHLLYFNAQFVLHSKHFPLRLKNQLLIFFVLYSEPTNAQLIDNFFSSKCSLFHNYNAFGSCIIHILYTGCAKIKKK